MDYKALEEEVSGILPAKAFRKIYEEATRERHSFLTIRLDQPEDMFFKGFSERLHIINGGAGTRGDEPQVYDQQGAPEPRRRNTQLRPQPVAGKRGT